jgi:hypothetical protein
MIVVEEKPIFSRDLAGFMLLAVEIPNPNLGLMLAGDERCMSRVLHSPHARRCQRRMMRMRHVQSEQQFSGLLPDLYEFT